MSKQTDDQARRGANEDVRPLMNDMLRKKQESIRVQIMCAGLLKVRMGCSS